MLSTTVRSTRARLIAAVVAARVLLLVGITIGRRLEPVAGMRPRDVLFMWDGAFYRDLAVLGYGGTNRDAARFFPLFPLLGRWLATLLGGRTELALMLIANGAAVAATFVLHRLVTRQLGDEHQATKVAVIFTLFPASAVLCLPYSESLTLLLVFIAALALVDQRPMVAIAPLVAAGLTRPTGVLLCIPVALLAREALTGAATRDRGKVFRWAGAVFAPLAGIGLFLLWLKLAGRNWSDPIDIQRELRAGFAEPVSRFVRMLWSVGTGNFRDAYNLGFTVLLMIGLGGAIKSKYSPPWTIYLGIGLVIALASNNVDSIGRYGVVLAPAWAVGLAALTQRRWTYVTLLAGSGVGLVAITALWVQGAVVP